MVKMRWTNLEFFDLLKEGQEIVHDHTSEQTKHKGQMQIFTWKGYDNLFGRKEPNSELILHHNNISVHNVLGVCEFLAKKSITKMSHPPDSPNLDSWDF